LRGGEADEAIEGPVPAIIEMFALDCFAPLAMTANVTCGLGQAGTQKTAASDLGRHIGEENGPAVS
jgi:hypothetical protein